MTTTYIPAIINEEIFPDGEAAQLLSLKNATPAAIAKATNSDASPNRKGNMKLAFLLQWDTSIAPSNVITAVVRSPFGSSDLGAQSGRPVVKVTPASVGAINQGVSVGPLGGAPGAAAPAVAADWSATFNSKPIPNWTVVITANTPLAAAGAVYVEIDFGATVAN